MATVSRYKIGMVKDLPQRFRHGHNSRRTMVGPPMMVVDMILAYEPRPHTQREVAEIMGVTFQAIEQTEIKAFRKLRRECKRVGLSWHDFCHVVGFTQPEAGE